MRMRFMGPCRTAVHISPDAVVAADPSYEAAWQALAEAVTADEATLLEVSEQSFAHSTRALARRPVRYETVTEDTPLLPAHVLDCAIRLDPGARSEILAGAVKRFSQWAGEDDNLLKDRIDLVPKRARLRLHYSGVMIVWFDLGGEAVIDSLSAGDEGTSEGIAAVEQLGNAVFHDIALQIDSELVSVFRRLGNHAAEDGNSFVRLLAGVRASLDERLRLIFAKSDDARVEPRACWTLGAIANPVGETSEAPVLWVTRSLIFDGHDDRTSFMLQPWLDPVSDGRNWQSEMENDGCSMPWLRYAFDETAMKQKGTPFVDAWESMLFSQFFWAALERVEHRMFRCLSEINGASRPADVRTSYANLDRAREDAELTLAHHRHLKRYLTRKRFRLVNQILEGWGFTRLVDNLHNVIAIARARHEQLLQRSAARSSVFTDLLLFGIGSVAVLDFFVGLSVVGRQLASDAAIGRRDEGWLDILGHFSDWRMDAVFSLGASLVIFAALLLLWYRRRQLY